MTTASRLPGLQRKSIIGFGLILGMMLGCVNLSFAGNREQAWRIYERLTGTAPSNTMLDAMTDCITNGVSSAACANAASSNGIAGITSDGPTMATFLAMKDPNFLGVTVKNMVMPWTNKDQTVFAPLNDAAATMIGMVRDGVDFRQVLYGDILYYDPDSSAPPYVKFVNQPDTNLTTANDNYLYLENNNKNMQSTQNLVSTTQEGKTGMPSSGVAGVLTTRAMQRAFFYAGTNRAMLRFTFMNFMCNDFVQIKDVNANPDRVRQDPSRSPGGDSSVFLHNCVGCHAGMDGLAGAYAYYNWGTAEFNPDSTVPVDNQISTYRGPGSGASPQSWTLSGQQTAATLVVPKYLQNFTSFPDGYVTTDDSWVNYWRTGPDANLGWGWGDGSGNNPQHVTRGTGMSSLGQELANTYAFSQCQAIRVYRQVCMNDPDPTVLKNMVSDFKNKQFGPDKFDMRTLFSEAALDCTGKMDQ